MKFLIVESPAKARKIGGFLGRDFKVRASVGHVREIPPKGMNIDIKDGFKPNFAVSRGKSDVVKEIKEIAAKAEVIYLAMDPDREGEGIAWHIYDLLNAECKKKCKRVSYGEVNEKAVKKAIAEAREIDMDLVDAQKARQVLDRLIGYKISPVLWYSVAKGTSAGRVQSIALRIICDRQKEIDAFKSVTYWYVEALLSCDKGEFWARVVVPKEKDNRFLDQEAALKALEGLKSSSFVMAKVDKTEKKIKPPAPFDTTSMQSTCSSMLRWNATRVMKTAQSLYENGKITYLRTDSYNISSEALGEVRGHISENFGASYLPTKANAHLKKSKAAAQEAHECIRPTHTEDEGNDLGSDDKKLYDLIRNRFIACQMTHMIQNQVKYTVDASCGETLIASGNTIKFDGFSRVWNPGNKKDKPLPSAEKGDEFKLKDTKKTEHKTKPPDRFTDGTLVKKMEDDGIGRPSTRASILKALVDKGYCSQEKGAFIPEDLGVTIVDFLVPAFKDFIMDAKFTSRLEDRLDEIAHGNVGYLEVVSDVYDTLAKEVNAAKGTKVENGTGVACSVCKTGEIIKRTSRNGPFFGCNGYPDCKSIYTETEEGFALKKKKPPAKPTGDDCPKCGEPLVIRKSVHGEFVACSGFPKCRHIVQDDSKPKKPYKKKPYKKKASKKK
jgi:DNA topoisomerase-1